jgi:hypothetical protein
VLEDIPQPRRRLPLSVEDLTEEPPDDRRDAERWRALFTGKLRVLTEVAQPHSNPLPGSQYLLVELWSDHIAPTNRLSAHALISYADSVIKKGKR